MNSPKHELSFKQALLEAIDEGLLTLGKSGKEAIYFHLQNLCALKKEDIPDKPEIFVEGLQKIFGLGAEVIEKAIVKNLYLKLGLAFKEKKGYSFLEYLNDVKHLNK
jgi:hypothetical protein